MRGETTYNEIVILLKNKGYKEQICGEIPINNTIGTNFLTPDNSIITIGFEYYPDDEVLEELFEEEK